VTVQVEERHADWRVEKSVREGATRGRVIHEIAPVLRRRLAMSSLESAIELL